MGSDFDEKSFVKSVSAHLVYFEPADATARLANYPGTYVPRRVACHHKQPVVIGDNRRYVRCKRDILCEEQENLFHHGYVRVKRVICFGILKV